MIQIQIRFDAANIELGIPAEPSINDFCVFLRFLRLHLMAAEDAEKR
jgi:hypothetical protein